ncbi:hypothetical protein ITJ86_05145 [Winogradskyella sp. F6397]|uniref:Nuclear transport factor 2 family protein n=1 Tax=Winogradskyella marina TaxID=2785530 RepID=A0ABS0EFP8_9FLAO|nr:hypothetical protein [Winogradskyella marina]MBF8149270.1 hypothetical protein [Winogradskyella marina]
MKTQELVNKIAKKEDVKSFLLKVLEAFQNMDYHQLSDLLDNDAYYEDMNKTAFIYRQKNIFAKFQNKGDEYLELSTEICTACLCSEPVFVLSGAISNLKYAIYVKFIDDEIVDIYRCTEQSDFIGSMPF